MRVTFSRQYKGFSGGESADLPGPEARDLIARGRARKAEPEGGEPEADEPFGGLFPEDALNALDEDKD